MSSDELIALIHGLTTARADAARVGAWPDVAAADRQIKQLRLALLKQRAEHVDPRLVSAYRRKKRQCVGCGAAVCKFVMCAACRETLAYCPDCESVYPRRASLPAECSSEWCTACSTRRSQLRRGGGTREAYTARRQERRTRLLPAIIELRRAHKTFGEIGEALSLTETQVIVLVRDARKHGEWPVELRRSHGNHR